jgi:PhoH-like ATPase
VVVLVGHAGTGKTILTLAAAIEQKLLTTSPGKVYIFRPNDQVADDIGFLPGKIDEKFSPYKRAIRDAYEVIQTSVEKVKKSKRVPDFDSLTNDEGGGKMPILPINFMRGSTLHNSIMLIDEAQNFSAHQMKTLLTRAGRNTRVMITGDPDQIDNRFLTKRSCGLTHVIGNMQDHDIFAYINLTQGERSEIASLAARVL